MGYAIAAAKTPNKQVKLLCVITPTHINESPSCVWNTFNDAQ
jgi:hypothetical protein